MNINTQSKIKAKIPVVDITRLRDKSDPVEVARSIHDASKNYGFLYVSNHGVPRELIKQARQQARRFFRLPLEEKLKIEVNSAHRGFIRAGNSQMTELDKPDYKESFVWGHELTDSQLKSKANGKNGNENPFSGDNQWPGEPKTLKNIALTYFDEVHQLAHDLLSAFAIGAGLKEDTFLKGSNAPISRGSLIYYPPQPESLGKNQFGVAPHTDFGVLTILNQDNIGGLQVLTYDNEWIDAEPIDDTLIINVGDLLHRWSSYYYRSTPHRVINTSNKERISLVVAYDPSHETMIEPVLANQHDETPQIQTITCGDYLRWRFSQSFNHLQNSKN